MTNDEMIRDIGLLNAIVQESTAETYRNDHARVLGIAGKYGFIQVCPRGMDQDADDCISLLRARIRRE